MNLKQLFGTNVRHHRRATGKTQEQLAEQVEVSIETIGKIERGVAAPSFDTVERIATALSVNASALFGSPDSTVMKGERGKLISEIHTALANMNDEQMARVAKMLDAFMGR
jgi:transcriptional regulator with XRE-family HTH domain